jgi:uncharacterized membrane protein (UPF0136 family)
MQNLASTVLWVYIVLLLIGGLMGYLKAKSRVSVISSTVCAVILILTGLQGVFQPSFARGLANIVMLVLLIVFTIRLIKTKKFMPAGMMLFVTIAALALRNITF